MEEVVSATLGNNDGANHVDDVSVCETRTYAKGYTETLLLNECDDTQDHVATAQNSPDINQLNNTPNAVKLALSLGSGMTLAACGGGGGGSGAASSSTTTQASTSVSTTAPTNNTVTSASNPTDTTVATPLPTDTTVATPSPTDSTPTPADTPVATPTSTDSAVVNPSEPTGTTVTEPSVSQTGTNEVVNAPEPTPDPPTQTQAARFLHQAQFHASDETIESVVKQGFEGWLDSQMSLPVGETGWNWLIQNGFNQKELVFDHRPMDFMLWKQLITSPDALRKRVALALSEILVVSTNSSFGKMRAFSLAAYWDVLNEHAFGNYRELLEAMSLNLGMGYYLNTKGNRKENLKTGRQPDENYARELLQLFSIGLYELNSDGSHKLENGKPVETYTNQDIINLARVFTGYDRSTIVLDTPEKPEATKAPMQLNPTYHSTKQKQFLGLTIPANTAAQESLRQALDHIFSHNNVPPFISKQLIQRLVTSNPSRAYVQRVARVFEDNGSGVRGDMKAVIKAVLLDKEARGELSEQAYGFGKLREPMLRILQWARTFNATSQSGKWKATNMSSPIWAIGQGFLRAPSVFNFFRPGYIPPNTELAERNLVAPEFQITNETTNTNYINNLRTYIQFGIASYETWKVREIIPDYSTELALVEQPKALVNRLNLLLTANQLSESTVLLLTNTIASMSMTMDDWKKRRVWSAVWLVMCAPEYLVQR